MQTLLLVLAAVIIAFAVEYVTRGLEQMWRVLILAVVAVLLVIFLARILGLW